MEAYSIFIRVYSLSVLRVGIAERHGVVRIVASEEQPAKTTRRQRCQIGAIKSMYSIKFTTCINDSNLEALEHFITLVMRAGSGTGI